jgi:hypothetical protein
MEAPPRDGAGLAGSGLAARRLTPAQRDRQAAGGGSELLRVDLNVIRKRSQRLPWSDHAPWEATAKRLVCVKVPLTPIVVHVVRPGARAEELLVALSRHLGQEISAPDELGHVRILLQEPLVPAWQQVHDGLAAAGDDWEQHLQLNPLPS